MGMAAWAYRLDLAPRDCRWWSVARWRVRPDAKAALPADEVAVVVVDGADGVVRERVLSDVDAVKRCEDDRSRCSARSLARSVGASSSAVTATVSVDDGCL